ncbi:ATP-binding protein [Streptomyces xiaopingdaonensis]|uniref:ATP-binding protein n=1 Tax=Streptomyces xiaopingdaonensis TaxID=1565415 RepID=UPI00035D9C1F|nr:tetratricopeptide repeat protein [Streptomyces xiaopingdaonensis]
MAEFNRLDELLEEEESDSASSSTVVVTGTAGVGKTSFALRWARRIEDQFPDGRLYTNLRGYDPGAPRQPEEVLPEFLTALGVPSLPGDVEVAAALYRSCLADRRVLVVLDNAATAQQVRPLLPAGPGCLTLVTSRRSLPSLAVHDGAFELRLDLLADTEAIALLRTVIGPSRTADEAKLAELASLCARLPLALRIAAERAAGNPHLDLDDLIADLRDESSRWSALSTGDDEEAGAVRAVFAWSYQALPAPAARLFRLLGLHPGPDFSAHAASALASATLHETRRLLDTLVGAHLVTQKADRYELHDLLRAYAADQVRTDEPEEEREAALRRILTWYLQACDEAQVRIGASAARSPLVPSAEAAALPSFDDYDRARTWSETEHTNLLAATRAAAAEGFDTLAWQLPLTHLAVWKHSAPMTDWIETGLLGLTAARRLGDGSAEARTLRCLGDAHTHVHLLSEGEAYTAEALALYRRSGDRMGEANSLEALGLVRLRKRELPAALAALERAREVIEELGEERWLAHTLTLLTTVRREVGDLAGASAAGEQALATCREFGDRRGEGAALRALSDVHRESGRYAEALEAARESVEIAVAMRHWMSEGFRLLTLGAAQRVNGMPEAALESFHRAAGLYGRLGDRGHEAEAWHGTGETYRLLDRAEDAADFHRRAAAAFADLDDRWHRAVALDGLASALRATDPDQAARHWRTALDLLAEYDDVPATALRDGIRGRLG